MSAQPLCVALRADASPRSGTGHVVRCLSLAAAMRDAGAQVCLVSRALGVDLDELGRRAGIEHVELPAPTSRTAPDDHAPHADWSATDWATDAQETTNVLASRRCSWVIVDHYAFDARWHRQVASTLGARIAAIDDLGDRDFEVDCLIDHNHCEDTRRKYAGRIGAGVRVLGGPRYALLGPAYADLQPRQCDDTVASIGIFLGGIDAAGLSSLALRACREGGAFAGPVEIATTSANPHLAALRALASDLPPTTLLIDQPDLSAFFTRHGLQIGAGGGATWERCCAGAPSLLLVAAANQQVVVPQLAALGAVAALAPGEANDLRHVGALVAELLTDAPRRHAMAGRGRELVDGLGARRVALALFREHLTLRPARNEDADTTHGWRNHPSTRQVSRDAREITADAHRQWWHQTLRNPNRRLFMAHVGRIDVGVLRLDLEGDGAEVSIYLDPAFTGLGLGPAMLRAAQRWLTGQSTLHRLLAHILPDNRASEQAFASAGFVRGELFWSWSSEPQSHHPSRRPE